MGKFTYCRRTGVFNKAAQLSHTRCMGHGTPALQYESATTHGLRKSGFTRGWKNYCQSAAIIKQNAGPLRQMIECKGQLVSGPPSVCICWQHVSAEIRGIADDEVLAIMLQRNTEDFWETEVPQHALQFLGPW